MNADLDIFFVIFGSKTCSEIIKLSHGRKSVSFNATTQHSDSELESADNGLLVTANVADIKPPEMPQFELDVAEFADRGVV